LETPSSIRVFGDSGGLHQVPTGSYKKEPSKDFSKFACSDPYRIFSEKGAAEIRRIGHALKVEIPEKHLLFEKNSPKNIFRNFNHQEFVIREYEAEFGNIFTPKY